MSDMLYPFLRQKERKPNGFDQYYEEPKLLGVKGMNALMDEGKRWAHELSNTLRNGGAVLFPHTFLSQCGYQIAAGVHAVLDSGADQALVLGTLHPMTQDMVQARTKELNDKDISAELSRGIFDPENDPHHITKHEFSLNLFHILFDFEVKRRGIKPPKLFVRYPSLANREPAKLPGIQELKDIVRDAVVVATDDMCHHGVGYGVAEKDAFHPDEKGYRFARSYIEVGYSLLKDDNYRGYFSHWMNPMAIGDPTDVATVLKYLLGDVTPRVIDLKLVDLATLYVHHDTPSWVAATLAEFQK